MDPGDIVKDARIVEVEDEPGSQGFTRVIDHHHSPPRCLSGSLHPSFPAFSVRGQPGAESHRLVVKVEACGRIIDHGSLVDVDVESVVRPHLEGCLHSGRGEGLLRGVPLHLRGRERADLRKAARRVVIFLSVIVSRNPPGCVVARHSELRDLVLYDEVFEPFLLRELVAEAEAVVVEPEADDHDRLRAFLVSRILLERDSQLIVVVADVAFLAPDRLPRLIEGVPLDAREDEPVAEASRLAIDLVAFLLERVLQAFASDLEPHPARQDHRLAAEVQ